MYDSNNVFAKILRGEIPAKKIVENDYAISFHDAFPKTKVHALVIPKGQYVSSLDFAEKATAEERAGFWEALLDTVKALNLQEGGYRLISNHGKHAHQEVPHFHMHICGGQDVGPMFDERVL